MQKGAPELLHRHLLGIAGASREEIKHVLDRVDGYVELNGQAEKKASLLRLRTIINRLFESSTRTRTLFEIAGKPGKGEEAAGG
jgi:aspartate carbamoyltransferase catalytic subunit